MSRIGNRELGSYTLIKRLAIGGMSEIWLAEQRGISGFSRRVVIKTILDYLADDPELIEMFLDEARIVAGLTHPNIAQIYDLGKIDDTYYLVMEYIQGRDLRHLMAANVSKEKPVSLNLILKIMAEVCAGLFYAHTWKTTEGKPALIVHRDISPDNIICTFEGTVKIVDFGIAKASHQAKTKTGVLKGKYAYMSPEQVKGKTLDFRSDIFSLGVVFYELISGRRLFKREGEVATLEAVCQAPIPKLADFNPKVPSAVERIVLQALSKDPKERFEDSRAMQLAIEQAMIDHQLLASSADLSAFMKQTFEEGEVLDRKESHSLKQKMEQLPDVTGSGSRFPKTAPIRPSLSIRGEGQDSQPKIQKTKTGKHLKDIKSDSETTLALSLTPLPKDPLLDLRAEQDGGATTETIVEHQYVIQNDHIVETESDPSRRPDWGIEAGTVSSVKPTRLGIPLTSRIQSWMQAPVFFFVVAFVLTGFLGLLGFLVFGSGNHEKQNPTVLQAVPSNAVDSPVQETQPEPEEDDEGTVPEIKLPDKEMFLVQEEQDTTKTEISKPSVSNSHKTGKKPAKKQKWAGCVLEEKKGFGTIDVGVAADSWGYVFINGEKIKSTPLYKHKLKAGRHAIELKESSGKLMRRWCLSIAPKQHVRLLHQPKIDKTTIPTP